MFDFSLFFNAFLIDFGSHNGTPKGTQNLSKIRLGRPKAPQGRQRPPRSLQGAILKPPGSHFGAILGSFLDHFGDMLGHFPTQVTCKPWAYSPGRSRLWLYFEGPERANCGIPNLVQATSGCAFSAPLKSPSRCFALVAFGRYRGPTVGVVHPGSVPSAGRLGSVS